MRIASIFAAILVVILQSFNTFAQPAITDPIKVGYERMYSGDVDGAGDYFLQIANREPDNLGAGFGVLMAMYEKGLQSADKQKEFESRIDQLIQKAEARYNKSKKDSEALFYLSQAYLHRGRFRVDFDKGMWGASRDAIAAFPAQWDPKLGIHVT